MVQNKTKQKQLKKKIIKIKLTACNMHTQINNDNLPIATYHLVVERCLISKSVRFCGQNSDKTILHAIVNKRVLVIITDRFAELFCIVFFFCFLFSLTSKSLHLIRTVSNVCRVKNSKGHSIKN